MTKREKELIALVELLMRERDCLRSVLSEFGGDEPYRGDKSEFVQWNIAEDLSVVIENLYTIA